MRTNFIRKKASLLEKNKTYFKMKKINLILISFLFLGQSFSQELLTLDKAIELTLENNYDIIISKNTEQIAKNNSGVLNTGFLPTLTTSAGGNYSIKDNSVGLTNGNIVELKEVNSVSYNTNLTLNYTLFDGLGRLNSLKKFKEQYNLSQLQTEFVIENTLFQVLNQYYTVAQQYQTIENLKESMRISTQRLTKAQYSFDYGQTTNLDVLNAEVDFNNDSINLLRSLVQLDNAKRNLNLLMGVNIDFDYMAETDIIFNADLNLENLLATAKENNTTLSQYEKNILLNQFDIKIARANWLPKLNVSGSYGFNNVNNDSNSGFNSPVAVNYSNSYGPSAALSLSWNLFDGGKTQTNIQNAKINLENKETSLENQKLILERDIQVAWYSYKNALEIIAIQTQNLETNKTNFIRTDEKYKIGQVNSIFFRQAQVNLLNAENQLNIAKYNAKVSELNLVRLSGKLLEEF